MRRNPFLSHLPHRDPSDLVGTNMHTMCQDWGRFAQRLENGVIYPNEKEGKLGL